MREVLNAKAANENEDGEDFPSDRKLKRALRSFFGLLFPPSNPRTDEVMHEEAANDN